MFNLYQYHLHINASDELVITYDKDLGNRLNAQGFDKEIVAASEGVIARNHKEKQVIIQQCTDHKEANRHGWFIADSGQLAIKLKTPELRLAFYNMAAMAACGLIHRAPMGAADPYNYYIYIGGRKFSELAAELIVNLRVAGEKGITPGALKTYYLVVNALYDGVYRMAGLTTLSLAQEQPVFYTKAYYYLHINADSDFVIHYNNTIKQRLQDANFDTEFSAYAEGIIHNASLQLITIKNCEDSGEDNRVGWFADKEGSCVLKFPNEQLSDIFFSTFLMGGNNDNENKQFEIGSRETCRYKGDKFVPNSPFIIRFCWSTPNCSAEHLQDEYYQVIVVINEDKNVVMARVKSNKNAHNFMMQKVMHDITALINDGYYQISKNAAPNMRRFLQILCGLTRDLRAVIINHFMDDPNHAVIPHVDEQIGKAGLYWLHQREVEIKRADEAFAKKQEAEDKALKEKHLSSNKSCSIL